MHTTFKRFLLLMLAVVLLISTSLAVGPLHVMREKYELTSEPVKGVSPQLALATQVFGWARGIIIDVIWIRMEALKRQCRFYELVQLADWACKLAPRIPKVWDFQSWNMAYNVSIYVDRFEERWPWVRSGIELLRDQAIPANPNAIELYQRLAFLIWHKVGQPDDNAHMFYKEKFAQLMHEVLGGRGDPQTLQRFVDAPDSREELLQDEDVRHLVDNCQQLGFRVVDDYFLWYRGAGGVPEKVNDLLSRPYNAEPLDEIATYVRAKRLREEYKLDPKRMLSLMGPDAYGPFDWRSPYPHAIYWAVVGLEKLNEGQGRLDAIVDEFGLPEPRARTEFDYVFDDSEGPYEFERVGLERVIYGSLQSLVAHGRMLFAYDGKWLKEWGPDYRFADATVKMYRRAWQTWLPRYLKGIRSGYVTFLGQGVAEFHFMGDNAKSRNYYEMLKEEFPEHVREWSYDEYLELRIERYTSDMDFSQVRRLVRALFCRSFLYRGYGEHDAADKLAQKAVAIAKGFAPDRTDLLRERIRADKIRNSVLADILSGREGGIPGEVMESLKAWLGPENVAKILAGFEEPEKGLPEVEEVSDDLKRKLRPLPPPPRN